MLRHDLINAKLIVSRAAYRFSVAHACQYCCFVGLSAASLKEASLR
jgi:hypothetical protein